MLIQRNAVSEQSLVARCFVFLVDLAILQQFYFCLHRGNLLLQVGDEFELISVGLRGTLLFAVSGFLTIVDALQIGMPLKLLVSRECRVLLIIIAACKVYCLLSALATVACDAT